MGAEYQQKKGHDLPDSHQGIQLMGKVLSYRSDGTSWDSGDLYPHTFDRYINRSNQGGQTTPKSPLDLKMLRQA